MTTLTTEDWTMMRELVDDVVKRRTAKFLTKEDGKNFATKDDLEKQLSPIKKQLHVIEIRLDGMDDKLATLTLNDNDSRARIYCLEQRFVHD
jgi:hypothetical protein